MAMTWDPGRLGPHTTLSGGSLVATEGTTTNPVGEGVYSSIALTGTGVIGLRPMNSLGDGYVFGIADGTASSSTFPGTDIHGFTSFSFGGQMVYNGALVSGSVTPLWASGDFVEMNYDIPGQQCRFRVNGGTYSAYQSWAGKISGAVYAAAGYFDAGQTLTLVPYSVGSASGTGAAAAVGASNRASAGASAAVSSVTAASASIRAAVGSSAATSSVAAVGTTAGSSTTDGVGSSAAVGAAAAVGASIRAAAGASAAASTVTGVGVAIRAAAGASSAASAVTGVSQAIKSAAGAASAVGAATAVGARIAEAVGAASAVSSVTATATKVAQAVGASSAVSAVSGIAYVPTVIAAGVGSAVSSSVAHAIGSIRPKPSTIPLAIEGDPTTIRRSLAGGGSVVACSIPPSGRVVAEALKGRP